MSQKGSVEIAIQVDVPSFILMDRKKAVSANEEGFLPGARYF